MEEKNAGEAVEPKVEEENTPESVTEEELKETSPASDPLDAIEDEDARNLAKRERAIAVRRAKKAAQPAAPEPVPAKAEEPKPVSDPSNYATKDDLKVLATNEAKKLVAPEVLEAWDELTKVPLGGFDPMDASSIAANMQQRFILHSNGKGADAPDLIGSPAGPKEGGGGGHKKAPEDNASLPGYKEPVDPADWYPKEK